MSNDPELINGPRTIHVFSVDFKRLFENPLVVKNFDTTKVDILDLKEEDIEQKIKDHGGWFKKEGADKYSNDEKRKFLVFTIVAQKVMNVTVTYSPETGLYFIENNGTLLVKNKRVYSKLYSGSLIYKNSIPLSIPDLEFVIRQRWIKNTEMLTAYFINHEFETNVLFDFPIELASAKEISSKFKFELEEVNDFMGKGDLNESGGLSTNIFKSGGMKVEEYIKIP